MKKAIFASILALSACSVFASSKGDALIAQIKQLKPPAVDRSKLSDPGYVKDFQAKYGDYLKQRNDLIWQLYQADPANPKTADLMIQRWMQFSAPGSDPKAVRLADIDKVLAQNPPETIIEAGAYSKVMVDAEFPSAVPAGATSSASDDILKEANEFVTKYPKSQYAPELLFSTSFNLPDDKKVAVYKKILADYPDYKNDPMIQGSLNQTEAIGKPFALSFTDAISGKVINVADMKGKVVLVDFWATWCGPCVAEMPHVKEIYSKYHSKGLEIVGVSLDQPVDKGGLTSLKDFVAKNQIPWPMYYQGNFWDSKFSSSWGIMSIPTMFIVDKNGNFQGAGDARDQDFEARIQKLLGS